jgi:tetratricopeptide (TPR) repeat protein
VSMRLVISAALLSLLLSSTTMAQQDSGQNQPSPQSDQQKSRERSAEAGESSSRDTRIDVSPPKDDAKDHPNKKLVPPTSLPNPEDMTDMTGVQEMHPWNPYRAAKDDEVGDFYFKQGNYKGALARFQDALVYKDNDAVANFKMAECYQKLGQPEEAIPHYQAYLKILPDGPLSKQAKKALKKLGAPEIPPSEKVSSKSSSPQ